MGLINVFLNKFVLFANFLSNVFHSPISSIIYLFQGMADTVLGLLENIAKAIDRIFGSKLSDSVSGWRSGLKGMADNAVKKYAPNEHYEQKYKEFNLSMDSLGFKRMEYGKAYSAGYKVGENIQSNMNLSSLTNKLTKGLTAANANNSAAKSLGNTAPVNNPDASQKVNKIANDTGAIKDSVTSTDTELKYLREIAERQAINKFTTAEIKVDMSGMTNQINKEMDLDMVVTALEKKVSSALIYSAEGVHV